MTKKTKALFLGELLDLSRKHHIIIDRCMFLGAPKLFDMPSDLSSQSFYYHVDDRTDRLSWKKL